MLAFFKNLNIMEFQVIYLALFLIFSVINDFEWFWMANLHKNIQLVLEFFKAPFLVLHFSYYTLMSFLMIFSVILLSLLIILLSILSVMRRLILWRQLELASVFESDLWDTVDWGRKSLVDFNAGKTQLVLFNRSNNTGTIDVKMDGSALEEKSSLKMLGLTFSSKLDWGSYIISIAKAASKKIGALVHTLTYKKEIIWDIYGKCTYDIFKTSIADANNSEDFKAKFLSLEPRSEKLCPGFYNWFLTHHKKEFRQSVTKSAR